MPRLRRKLFEDCIAQFSLFRGIFFILQMVFWIRIVPLGLLLLFLCGVRNTLRQFFNFFSPTKRTPWWNYPLCRVNHVFVLFLELAFGNVFEEDGRIEGFDGVEFFGWSMRSRVFEWGRFEIEEGTGTFGFWKVFILIFSNQKWEKIWRFYFKFFFRVFYFWN